ncbi:MAG: M20/M25/M40 family metallo-hydrolase [Gemmatimonadaceae bacterium]
MLRLLRAILCLVPAIVLAQQGSGSAFSATIGLQRDDRIVRAMADVSAPRIRAIDSALVAFGTRHTMADTLSATRGIGAARRWIHAELSKYAAACNGCLRVEFDPAMIVVDRHPNKPQVNVVNVLAWLKGRDTSRVVVIGGHYDSCVCNVDRFEATADAPGADDDGSGTAAVIELARVMATHFPNRLEATVIFALYSGEELGLLGSTHLAKRLHDAGYKVTAAMTDDIVGNVVADDGTTDSTTVRIFAAPPDNGPSRELGRYVWALGSVYTPHFAVLPVWRLDRIGRGGDHSPFVRLGDAGLRFTEKLENYKRQHLPTDVLEHVNFGYVANVARVNLATVASLAAAPAAPDSVTYRRDRESGGQKFRLTWKAVPNADSYEILVRSTYAPTHERVIPAGRETTALIDVQLDDAWVAVRAVGAGGTRSIATVISTPGGT